MELEHVATLFESAGPCREVGDKRDLGLVKLRLVLDVGAVGVL